MSDNVLDPHLWPQLLLQYPITLPTDYDMQIIEERVRTRGPAFDDRAGLICKAYCVRVADSAESPVNEYAPFYLWGDSAAAAQFLWRGAGFDGIVRDFGRPAIHTWGPEAAAAGAVPPGAVTYATVRSTPIAQSADLVEVAATLAARVRDAGRQPGTHLAVAGIDPSSWRAVEFMTTDGAPVVDEHTTSYCVLHVSQPGPDR
ncbi:DUF4865 family protein [Flexivirga caeni]|uniref:DUF4865 family protein n=1 Tax=Flexivirga caeni TaxID=2294115 RepID=UPI001C65D979|nr:DUF4865 family protein [Flexivirga caeni]